MRKPITWGLLAAYLLVLCTLTLGGLYQPNPPKNFVPFQTIVYDIHRGGKPFLINILGNLGVFLPVGLLGPLLLKQCNLWRVAGMSFGLSLIIEVLQGLSRRRVADVDDLILDTLGGLIGYGVWVLIRSRFAQKA